MRHPPNVRCYETIRMLAPSYAEQAGSLASRDNKGVVRAEGVELLAFWFVGTRVTWEWLSAISDVGCRCSLF